MVTHGKGTYTKEVGTCSTEIQGGGKWAENAVGGLWEVPHASFMARNDLIHEETVDMQK